MDNKYQLSRIHNYVAGLMSEEDMYAMEREAIEDPLLQDAIDGYRIQNGVDQVPLSILQKRLAERIGRRKADRNLRHSNWQRLAVGLLACVLFVVVCSLWFFGHFRSDSEASVTQIIYVASDLRITIQAKGDAAPTEGWEQFGKKLADAIPSTGRPNAAKIEIDVRNGTAQEIRIDRHNMDPTQTQILLQQLRSNAEWKGRHAALTITIDN